MDEESGRFDNDTFYTLLKDRKDDLASKTTTEAEVARQVMAAESRMRAQSEQNEAALRTELTEMQARLAQFQGAPAPMDV
jgi:hypothetical protein